MKAPKGLDRDKLLLVESIEGVSEIWFCEPFLRWGVLRFRVSVRVAYG